MAIISMKKVLLVGLNKERNKILKHLHRMGCLELSSVANIDKTKVFSDIEQTEDLKTKLARINFTFGFLRDMRVEAVKLSNKYQKLTSGKEPEIVEANDTVTSLVEYKPYKKPFNLGLPSVQYDIFDSIFEREEELFDVIHQVESINSSLIDIKSDMIRLKSINEQLLPYIDIDAKFSQFKDTKNTTIMLGAVPNNKLSQLDEISDAYPDSIITPYHSSKMCAVSVIAPINQKEEISSRLVELDFVLSSFNYDMIPLDKYKQSLQEYSNLESKREELITKSVAYEQFIPDFQILYDYNLLELRKIEANQQFRFTESTFVMEGWCPAEIEERLYDNLNDNYTVFIDIREPLEEEVIPTLTRNNSVVAPYENITNMYSVPNQREIDPNPFVALFYFLFFGIMVSDAGYGLILAIGAYFLYRYAKPRKGEGKLVLVIAMGGVSTFIWGIMFGGWFGMTINPLLFDPLKNPIAMLGLSLGLGLFQIMFGMGIRAVSLFKEKKYLDAICNIFGWYAVFLGLGLFALSMVPNLGIFNKIGFVVALVGVAGVLIGGGIGKKGIGGKLGGALGNIYSVTGFLSDILSYSRLFGLGLATGVVGMVINQLAGVAIELIPLGIGYIIAIPVLIGGHIFNIAINTLGAYVHNSRLQYIEFFSRFYTGAGHEFIPFGTNTKYVYIDN